MDFKIEMSWLGINFTPWRLLTVILALPTGIGAMALYFFLESPKFLYGRGRKEEALNVLKKMYEINHRGCSEEYQVSYNAGVYTGFLE